MKTTSLEHNYASLIAEVFIKPIRSVLIIDDQYPTIAEQLSDQSIENGKSEEKGSKSEKTWRAQPDRISTIIDHFRERRWLVDIHDGKIPKGKDWQDTLGHLHQSDLLILDYQLDGNLNGGEKCIRAIAHVASNDQFNLIVVHTDSPDINTVFNDVLISLLPPCQAFENLKSKTENAVSDWEEHDDEIAKKLSDSIDDELYLDARIDFGEVAKEINKVKGSRFGEFLSLFEAKPESVILDKISLLRWLLGKHQQAISPKLNQQPGALSPTWCGGSTNENWIRTDKLFVTVSSKNEAKDLPETLHQALINWAPKPPRLVLAKLRSELEATGVAAEDVFLNNTSLQVAWYDELLKSAPEESTSRIQNTIRNYWNGISEELEKQIVTFTKALLQNPDDATLEPAEILKKHFGEITSTASTLRLNAYNCSTSPKGHHLTPGHIIERKGTFWICLSPSCDLVPGQKDGGRFGRLKSAMPFKAVQLYRRGTASDGLPHVNDNCQIFIELDKNIVAFSFLPLTGKDAEETPGAPNPTWDELYAKNNGRIPQNGSMILEIGQLEWNDDTEDHIAPSWEAGTIVGQLRYEYAINLMQRLGYTLSRVGLDFVR